MSLHTDYRPDNFEDFIGNKDQVESLKRILDRENPPPAFLFTGSGGTGKTTLGRITKNYLKCDNTDFKEMNAADDRGIDAIRGLLESMRLAPLSGNKKVILLDEAHMLTKPSQEALLKALEEPPSYVHFVICTTNPEALKQTFKRRCHHYELSPLTNNEIGKLLTDVIRKEKRRPNKDVISNIIELSDGSAGQALKLLDQVIDIMRDPKRAISVLKSAGSTEAEVIDICRILTSFKMNQATKWMRVKKILAEIKADPESARRQILGYLNTVLLNKGGTSTYLMMEEFKENYYDSGKAGLSMSCFAAIHGEDDE